MKYLAGELSDVQWFKEGPYFISVEMNYSKSTMKRSRIGYYVNERLTPKTFCSVYCNVECTLLHGVVGLVVVWDANIFLFLKPNDPPRGRWNVVNFIYLFRLFVDR